ncbi:MAG: PE family protein [Mycobacterium sp.]|uniref:PE family protein n=1 Tax=Mycobacterium sp. TaxID=1785 RepID=UPI001ECE6D6E|nr:PE family protein [Mycobacterium sp.]
MSFVSATPESVTAAANNLAQIGSTLSEANEAAAAPTTASLAAAADGVSAVAAAAFNAHAQGYQQFGAQLAALHDQFVQALSGTATSYAATEASNVSAVRDLLA